MRVIGLAGRAGSGKGVVAEYLVRQNRYVRLKFADPMKAMLRAYYECLGVPSDEVERRIEGDLKEIPCPFIAGKSPRYAMQTIGTEWGRDLMSAGIWTHALFNRANYIITTDGRVVVDDVRFYNEAATIRELGGEVWMVDRTDAGTKSEHVSERLDFTPDRTITNNRSVEDLLYAVAANMRSAA